MTLTEWMAALTAIRPTGVKRVLTAPPSTINAADLPLLFPRLPTGETVYQSFGASRATATGEVVIVIAPDGLNMRAQTFAQAITLADALSTALAGVTQADRWTIRIDAEAYGTETGYTVLVAAVEGS